MVDDDASDLTFLGSDGLVDGVFRVEASEPLIDDEALMGFRSRF